MALFLFFIDYMAHFLYISHHVFVANILITVTVKGCSSLHVWTDEEKKRTKKKKHRERLFLFLSRQLCRLTSTVQVMSGGRGEVGGRGRKIWKYTNEANALPCFITVTLTKVA